MGLGLKVSIGLRCGFISTVEGKRQTSCHEEVAAGYLSLSVVESPLIV